MALETIHIPETVFTLGRPYYYYDNPFAGCTSLREFSGKFATDDGLCLLSGNGLNERNALVSVAIGCGADTFRVPDGVHVIAESAFGRARFKTVDLNETIQINQWAFSLSYLESMTIPSSVGYINDYAFSDCRELTDMWFDSDVLHDPYPGVCHNHVW